jgi:hypothetical protein
MSASEKRIYYSQNICMGRVSVNEYYLLSVIYYLLFVIYYLLSINYYLSYIICYILSIICYRLSLTIIYYLLSIIYKELLRYYYIVRHTPTHALQTPRHPLSSVLVKKNIIPSICRGRVSVNEIHPHTLNKHHAIPSHEC